MAAIEDNGGRMFAHSPVTKIEERKDGVTVTTEDGATVTGARAIFATNSPINDRVAIHTKMAPYRTYAMAFTVPRGALPDALYWDMADPYHYVRLNPGPGTVDYLIVGGADHKTGEADDGSVRFEAIEAWIRALGAGAGERGPPVVRAGARHDRLLRLHRAQPGQQERVRRHRRFRAGHDARRACGRSAERPDHRRLKPVGGACTIPRARRPPAFSTTSAKT